MRVVLARGRVTTFAFQLTFRRLLGHARKRVQTACQGRPRRHGSFLYVIDDDDLVFELAAPLAERDGVPDALAHELGGQGRHEGYAAGLRVGFVDADDAVPALAARRIAQRDG